MLELQELNEIVKKLLKNNKLNKKIYSKWLCEENQYNLTKILNLKADLKPKKCRSAYLFFCEVNGKRVTENLGKKAKFTEITKELIAQWKIFKKKATAKNKKNMLINPYLARELAWYKLAAFADKKRYNRDMAKVNVDISEKKVLRITTKKKKSRKKIKRGYDYFCEITRPKYKIRFPTDTKVELIKRLARKWKSLTPKDRKKYFSSLY